MDRQAYTAQARILRGITSRLNNTNPSLPSQLIVNAQRSVADISFCKTLLTTAEEKLKISQTDAGVIVHSFKTKLSSLLQDKSPSSRLAAIILIKATVHIGGYEVLNKNCAAWARALLNLLAQPGPVQTRRLIIIVLVQIYCATEDLPNLTREVTTPTLKDFIPSCIALVTFKAPETNQRVPNLRSPLLPDVLHAFVRLLSRHPTMFRPFASALASICGSIVSLTSAQGALFLSTVKSESYSLARQLWGQLPRSAPRDSAKDEWSKAVQLLKDHITHTADQIFRSIVETANFESSSTQRHTVTHDKVHEQPVGQLEDDLHLTEWVGLDSGVDRLTSLLRTLQAFISASGPSNATYALPVDAILSLIERLLNAFPGQRLEALSTVASNPDISREERELLFLRSGEIQSEALKTLEVVCQRLGSSSTSVANGALEYIVWCFGSSVQSDKLRASYYDAVSAMLRLCGPGLSRKMAQSLKNMLHAASNDIWTRNSNNSATHLTSSQAKQSSADAYLTVTGGSQLRLALGPAHRSAKFLMRNLLKYIPAESFSNEDRALIDKSIILVRDEESMLASVLNVSSQRVSSAVHYSIMPFLAREHADSVGAEAILRPRLPPLANKTSQTDVSDEVETETERYDKSYRHIDYSRNSLDRGDASMELESLETSTTTFPTSGAATNLETPLPTEPNMDDHLTAPHSQISSVPTAQECLASPKRMRADEEVNEPMAPPKRVKLATFEAAPGPTSVAVIKEPSNLNAAHKHTESHDDSDSDGSSLPSIHMGDLDDDDDDDDDD